MTRAARRRRGAGRRPAKAGRAFVPSGGSVRVSREARRRDYLIARPPPKFSRGRQRGERIGAPGLAPPRLTCRGGGPIQTPPHTPLHVIGLYCSTLPK